MDRIRVGYASKAAGTAPVWTACEAGIFKDLDLDVDPVLITGSARVTQSLESGEIQLGNFAAPAALQANLNRGADLIVVLGAMNRLTQSLCGCPGVESLEQLKGGTIGIYGKNEVGYSILRMLLPRLGLEPDQDVRLVVVKRSTQKQWLRTDLDVDGLVLHIPEPMEAAKAGWTTLVDMRTMDIPFQLACAVGRQSWITAHQDIVHRYVRGHVEGILRFKHDRAFGIEVLKLYGSADDEDVLLSSYEAIREEFSSCPFPTVEAIRNILDTFQGWVPGADPARAEEYIDRQYMEALDASNVLNDLRKRYEAGS